MPRSFSELKSGGDNSYAVPHAEKWGDASPLPPPIDARVNSQVGSYTLGFVAIVSAHVCKLMLLCVFTPHHVHTYNVTGFSLLFCYDNAVVIVF